MGSFFKRCDASGLCIKEGDEAVVLPLLPNTGYRGAYRGPEYEYGPAGLPIYGTYADYGSLDPEPGLGLQYFRRGVHEPPPSDTDLLQKLTRHEAAVGSGKGLYLRTQGIVPEEVMYQTFWVRCGVMEHGL